MRKLLLAAAAFVILSPPCLAEVGDGKWFVEMCSLEALKKKREEGQSQYTAQFGYCNFFVMGVLHGHYASRAAYKAEPLFCLPPSLTPLQLTGEVVAIIQVQPESQSAFAAASALQGLKQRYPCKN